MRAIEKILFPFFAIILLVSCQKEVSVENGLTPTTGQTIDSAWYLASSQYINYNASGNALDTVTEYYYYDSAKIRLTSITATVGSLPDSLTKTFYYKADGKLILYELNTNINPDPMDIVSINFGYNGNDIASAISTYRNGYVGTSIITTQQVGLGKTITWYDTITPPFFPSPFRKYKKQIINLNQEGDIETVQSISPSPGLMSAGIFRLDTLLLTAQYDASGNMKNHKSFLRYFDTSFGTGGLSRYGFDSISYITRSARGIELLNTHKKIFSNAFWFDDSYEFSSSSSITSFYNTNLIMNGGMLADIIQLPCTSAVKTVNSISAATPNMAYTGNYQLSFDSNNRLIKMVVPEHFANKYDGKAVATFTYIKTRK
jgi:hypothetical protein